MSRGSEGFAGRPVLCLRLCSSEGRSVRDARQRCGASEQSSCACDVLHPVLEACRSSTVPIVAQRLTPALAPVKLDSLKNRLLG